MTSLKFIVFGLFCGILSVQNAWADLDLRGESDPATMGVNGGAGDTLANLATSEEDLAGGDPISEIQGNSLAWDAISSSPQGKRKKGEMAQPAGTAEDVPADTNYYS